MFANAAFFVETSLLRETSSRRSPQETKTIVPQTRLTARNDGKLLHHGMRSSESGATLYKRCEAFSSFAEIVVVSCTVQVWGRFGSGAALCPLAKGRGCGLFWPELSAPGYSYNSSSLDDFPWSRASRWVVHSSANIGQIFWRYGRVGVFDGFRAPW